MAHVLQLVVVFFGALATDELNRFAVIGCARDER